MTDILEVKEITTDKKSVLSQIVSMDHEQVLFCQDRATGLKAIIAVHNTVLGPALGGTRMWEYVNEAAALTDVLRLSRRINYKNSISGLNLGGGKAIIIGNSHTDKNEALFRRFGQFVNSLSGKYITAEDVGISTQDMAWVNKETNYVVGLPGKSGDPSPVTAYGVYVGMKACVKAQFGSDSLAGKKVAVQGAGHVGQYVIKHLTEEGAKVFVTDIYEPSLKEVAEKYGSTVVGLDEIYDLDVDIYAPCALGATINDDTISKIQAKVIAGAANNQLANEVIHGKLLKEKGILYAPDFLINAGGVINVYSELANLTSAQVMEKTENIYNTAMDIFNLSDVQNITTHQAALNIAQKRIDDRKKELQNK